MESLVSREATFLFNNLLLVGIAFAVLWGVLFPLISETVGDDRLNVTNPFFEFFAVAFGLPLVFLMGVGPLIAWRRASIKSLERTFMGPALTGLATGRAAGAVRLRHELAGRGGGQPVRVRRRHHRPGVRARRERPACADGRVVAARAGLADRQEPAALRRLHRPPGDGAAGDRRRGLVRVHHAAHGDAGAGPVARRAGLHADVQPADGVGGRRTTRRRVRSSRSRRAARCSGR